MKTRWVSSLHSPVSIKARFKCISLTPDNLACAKTFGHDRCRTSSTKWRHSSQTKPAQGQRIRVRVPWASDAVQCNASIHPIGVAIPYNTSTPGPTPSPYFASIHNRPPPTPPPHHIRHKEPRAASREPWTTTMRPLLCLLITLLPPPLQLHPQILVNAWTNCLLGACHGLLEGDYDESGVCVGFFV